MSGCNEKSTQQQYYKNGHYVESSKECSLTFHCVGGWRTSSDSSSKGGDTFRGAGANKMALITWIPRPWLQLKSCISRLASHVTSPLLQRQEKVIKMNRKDPRIAHETNKSKLGYRYFLWLILSSTRSPLTIPLCQAQIQTLDYLYLLPLQWI